MRRASRLRALASRVIADGGRAWAIRTDVGAEGEVHALVERTVAEHGRLDVVVCNAGFGIDLGSDPTNGYQNNVAFDNRGMPSGVSGQVNPGTSLGYNLCNGITSGC